MWFQCRSCNNRKQNSRHLKIQLSKKYWNIQTNKTSTMYAQRHAYAEILWWIKNINFHTDTICVDPSTGIHLGSPMERKWISNQTMRQRDKSANQRRGRHLRFNTSVNDALKPYWSTQSAWSGAFRILHSDFISSCNIDPDKEPIYVWPPAAYFPFKHVMWRLKRPSKDYEQHQEKGKTSSRTSYTILDSTKDAIIRKCLRSYWTARHHLGICWWLDGVCGNNTHSRSIQRRQQVLLIRQAGHLNEEGSTIKFLGQTIQRSSSDVWLYDDTE